MLLCTFGLCCSQGVRFKQRSCHHFTKSGSSKLRTQSILQSTSNTCKCKQEPRIFKRPRCPATQQQYAFHSKDPSSLLLPCLLCSPDVVFENIKVVHRVTWAWPNLQVKRYVLGQRDWWCLVTAQWLWTDACNQRTLIDARISKTMLQSALITWDLHA